MKTKLAALLALLLPALALAETPTTAPAAPPLPTIPPNRLSILDHAAVADGKTKNTAAIKAAIDALASAGGGTLVFPKSGDSVYLTGPIHLKSNIALQIDEGVTLLFSPDPADYPTVLTRWECTEIYNCSPLIYAKDCTNIAITGKGTIDGNGKPWWDRRKATPDFGKAIARTRVFCNDDSKPEDRVFGAKFPGLPPALLQPFGAKNVLLDGFTIKNSPFWTIHPVYTENLTARNLTVIGTGPNTDGLDPDSCKNVLIERCDFTTGDDCITIKSGRDKDGRRVGKPCENITVRNCTMHKGHGGVVIGSETAGGIRNVLVEDCSFDGPLTGIRIKSTRGRGGIIENITYRRIAMKNIPEGAFSLNMKYGNNDDSRTVPFTEATPVFRNFLFEDLTCTDSKTLGKIVGLPESPITNLVIRNATLDAATGLGVSDARDLTLTNVKLTVKRGEPVTFTNAQNVIIDGKKQ